MNRPPIPRDLLDVLAAVDSPQDIERIFYDLLTFSEIESLGERWSIVKRLAAGQSQRTIRDALGVSITTVSRGNRQLKYGDGGFEIAFNKLATIGHGDPRRKQLPADEPEES